MPKSAKNIFKFFFGIPLTIISLYFIFSFIYSNKEEIIPHLQNINPLAAILGIFFMIVFFFLRSLAWNSILKREGYKGDESRSMYLLAASEIRRYIPGSIVGFISRINSFSTESLTSKTVVKLIFFESIIFLITSTLVSIPGIFYIASLQKNLPPVYQAAIFFFVIITLTASSITIYFFAKRNSFDIKLFLKKLPEFATAFYLMTVAWIFFGVANYLIGASFYFLDPTKFIELSSFFVLSWLIGYVVLVVPLGLGVREAAVVFGLSSIIPAGIAAALSILLRLGMIAGELLFLSLIYFYNKSKIKIPPITKITIILWASIISYILYFCYFTMEKHLNFFTGRFDLGNMDQTVWNTLHGRIFMLTNPDGLENISRLGVHADFILILLSPFYLIWEDPRILLIIQTVVIALGAYFIFRIAEHIFTPNKILPLVFSLSYLLNPWVQKQNLFDFHAVSLATTFLLAAFCFVLEKKFRHFLLFLGLALLTKENVFLVAIFFGVFLFLKTKKKIWLVGSLLSGAIFYILVSKLMPAARGTTHFAIGYFEDFGETLPEMATTAILNPAFTFSKIVNPENINYFLDIIAPVGYLVFFSPLYLLFATPDFAINMLSTNENLRTITFHYGAVIIPFVYIASIYGVKNLLKIDIPFINTKTIALYVLFFSLLTTYQLGVLPGAKKPSLEIYTRHLSERTRIKQFLSGIDPGLSVAATNNLGAHLSHREKIYVLPYGLDQADVVVLLFDDYRKPVGPSLDGLDVTLRNDSRYIELYSIGRFSAFSKIEAAAKILPPR